MLNKTTYLGARFPEGEADLVKEVSRLRGEDISDFLRRAIYRELARLSYLDDKSKKALEVERG
jgi:hypothetical protein